MKTFVLHADYSPLNFIMEGINPSIDGNPVQSIVLRTIRKPRIQLLLASLGLACFFPLQFFTKSTLEELRKVKSGDKVILIEDRHRPILRALKDVLPKDVILYLFFHTPIPITSRSKRRLKGKSKMFNLSSFDADTRLVYPNIHIGSSFYRFAPTEMIMEKKDIKYDCFFVGMEKGRGGILKEIRETLEKAGLKCNFIIMHNGETFVPYDQTLQMMLESRCIVDVTLNTKGVTLRPLEALYFGKKLIVNSPDIINEMFYNPQNIFIWGKDNTDDLYDFIMSPYVPASQEVLNYYDINSWVRRFNWADK